MYSRILNDKVMEITEKKGDFRKERDSVDKKITLKMIVYEFLRKDRKLYVAFIDLEEVCSRVDREAVWSDLAVYGVEGQQLEGMKPFHTGASACVKVN